MVVERDFLADEPVHAMYCGTNSKHSAFCAPRRKMSYQETPRGSFEELMQELFRAHDLNENGFLEELELIQLNKKMFMLHYGKDADLEAVAAKYRDLFRNGLDPEGEPVPYETFRRYMTKVLTDIDPDRRAQIMIMEQFIAEAMAARSAFHLPSLASVSDLPFIDKLRLQEDTTAVIVPIWDRGLPASLSDTWEEHMQGDEKAMDGEVYVFRQPGNYL